MTGLIDIVLSDFKPTILFMANENLLVSQCFDFILISLPSCFKLFNSYASVF